ncbi:MAG: 6-bladed beta-propeller [Bacteroidales bacterium]|nr:6-bladed beta-propeller [Bacteroidales bacterium]
MLYNFRNRIIILISIALCFTSCKIFQTQPIEIEELVIYPPPPDKVRIQYLTSINNSEDIMGRRSPFMDFILGKEIPMGVVSPLEITSTESELIICDNILGGLELINLENKTFEYFIPDGRGRLAQPVSCTVDSSGNLFVVDKKRKQIVVFNNTEEGYKYKTAFGDTANYAPYDILAFKDKLWVPNTKTRKIHVYDGTNFNFLFSFPKGDRQDHGYIVLPKYIEGFGDNIYVTDFVGNTIKVFDVDGNFIRSVGSIGTFPGQFARAKDIAIDKDENLFAIDAAFGNVQIFNKKGQLLMFFGGQNANSGDMYLPRAIHISYEHNNYFEEYLDPAYKLKYIIYVSNQQGGNKVNVYGAVEVK